MVLFIRCKHFLESSKWSNVGGSKFSNNDGTWGLGKGNRWKFAFGIQSEIFWGHENCGGVRDKNACNRYKLGTSSGDPYLSSDNIRNEMFMGYPDTLPMTSDVNGYINGALKHLAGSSRVSYEVVA